VNQIDEGLDVYGEGMQYKEGLDAPSARKSITHKVFKKGD
jgi:hypothetical protein